MKATMFLLATVILATPLSALEGNKAASQDRVNLDRDGYVKVVENKLDTWDEMIKDIRSGTYKDKDFGKNTTPEEAEKLGKALEQEKERVSADLNRLKDAKGEQWKTFQARIDARFDDMNKKFGKKLSD